MITYDVGPGVHLVEHGYTNCYVIADDDGLTLVDAAYPKTWERVERCIRGISRRVEDVRGLLVTHGHFDHLGFASFVRNRFGIEVWAHPGDFPILANPYGYRPEHPRLLYPLAYPRSLPVLGAMVAAGALRVPPVEADRDLASTSVRELPGNPEVIHTPGHTDGSCVIALRDRRLLLSGDSLVTLDPYTGRRGPRIVARAATHDARQALTSLEPLVSLPVDLVLTGHGAPWRHGIAAAVGLAHEHQREGS